MSKQKIKNRWGGIKWKAKIAGEGMGRPVGPFGACERGESWRQMGEVVQGREGEMERKGERKRERESERE